MGQGYELPDSTIQRGPLGRDLPLGLRLRVRHLAPSLRLDLDHLGRQRVDGLDDPSTQGLHAGVVRFAKGTAGIGAAARKQGPGLAVLPQDQGGPTAGAVGGQTIRSLGTRGLGQVNGERCSVVSGLAGC